MDDEALLHELTGRMRRLARRLAATDTEADDLVQDAWVAALSRPPRDAGRLSNWLAVAMRNLARTRARRERRRIAREAAVAKAEAHEPVDRLGASRALLDAVHALDEPFRSAIVMRFLDELPPRVIAQRLGVPVETVRSRVRRGLQLLRERLERGDRRGLAMLVPLLRPRAAAVVPLLGVVMSTKVVVAAVVLLCVPVGVLVVRSGRTGPHVGAKTSRLADAAVQPLRAGLPSARAPEREVVATAPNRVGGAADVVFVGRCVADEDGRGLPGVTIALEPVDLPEERAAPVRLRGGDLSEPERVEVQSAEDGGFEVAGSWSGIWTQRLVFEAAGRVRVVARPPASWTSGRVELGDVRLPIGVTPQLRVVDTTGLPQVGFELYLSGPRVVAQHWLGTDGNLDATSGEGGFVTLEDRLVPGEWRVVCRDREVVGTETLQLSADDGSRFDVVVAAAADVETIEGGVVDERGLPLPDVIVRPWNRNDHWGAVPRTDRDGRFSIQRWSTDRSAPHQLRLTRPGYRSIETEPITWGARDLHYVMQPACAVDLLVLDAATDTPVERFGVRVVPRRHVVQDWRNPSGALTAVGDHPDGRATLRLPDGELSLYVQPGPTHAVSGPANLSISGSARREVVVRVAPLAPRSIRVVDATERPVVGSVIEVLRPGERDDEVLDLEATTWSWWRRSPTIRLDRAATDAVGLATLHAPIDERLTLRITGATHATKELDIVMAKAADLLTITVTVVGGQVTARIEPSDFGDRLNALGGDGVHAPPGVQLVQVGSGAPEHRWFPPRPVPIQADGTVQLEHVPPGDWQIVALAWIENGINGSDQLVLPIGLTGPVEEGGRREVRIDATGVIPGTARGRVFVDGQPHRDSEVRIRIESDVPQLPGHAGIVGFTARTDADGRFVLHRPPARFWVTAGGGFAMETGRVAPGATMETIFHVARGTLAVRFVDTAGAPVAAARGIVVIRSDARPPALHDEEVDVGPLDADATGTARIVLPPGRVQVGVLPADHPPRLRLDAALAVTTVEVPPGGEVEVRVLVPASAGY